MTLRERIADWISGGAITASNIRVNVLECRCDRLREDLDITQGAQIKTHDIAQNALARMERFEDALHAIIERGNTKAPNSTVRDMVRIAQKGLEK